MDSLVSRPVNPQQVNFARMPNPPPPIDNTQQGSVGTLANTTNNEISISGIVPVPQNLVATVDLCTKLDLGTIALHTRNAEYSPKRQDSLSQSLRGWDELIVRQKLGFNARFIGFKIQNIVGSTDVKFPSRLEGLANAHATLRLTSQSFSLGRLIYRMMKPKIVLLIFVSGKIVLAGVKVREEIYQGFEIMYLVLQTLHKI
ncbi:hypothetical protein CC78DRAFT_619168 [Lojkania enalia]|uniref:TATA-box binding protein n=1 Tax=Lojkania enalia TaxID=147567 RepID=A0A9P4K4H9_9PLEO|nr:hypothetical protein CC78DRAFT_619168 [Didymosphaeria enalia]